MSNRNLRKTCITFALLLDSPRKKNIQEKLMVKKLHLITLLFFSLILSSQAQDISGSWSWNSPDGGNMFTIDLMEISENNYRGNHCSVYLRGDKIDCNDNKDEFSIVLIRKAENIFQGSIRSGFSYAVGNVQLQYLPADNTILFSLKTHPKGEYYIPLEGVLVRN